MVFTSNLYENFKLLTDSALFEKKNSIIVSRSIWDILTEKLVCLRLTVVAYFVQNPMYDVISVKVSQIMQLTTELTKANAYYILCFIRIRN